MSNSYFQFKQFIIHQDKCAMKVTTDGCLFGAWIVEKVRNENPAITNCLDIGTGTGLLSLMLAQKVEVTIDAIEIENEAAKQATQNITTSQWKERITVIHADIKMHALEKKYDLIISNPPFYENELKSGKNQKNIAHHSENLELKDLITIIKMSLVPNGFFCLLLPYKRNAEVKALLTENDLTIVQLTFVRQSTMHNFFRIMLIGKMSTNEPAETIIDEITIKDSEQHYTAVFTNLLKDYYLNL